MTKSILTDTEKSCTRCGELKPKTEFHRMKGGRGGVAIWCKTCQRAYQIEHRRRPETVAKRRAKYRQHDLKKSFGITIAQYDAMLAAQGGVCAVCKRSCKSGRRLAVDHDHQTGAIRGLLCSGCNHGMGFLGDDPERLRAAARYLDEQCEEVIPAPRVHRPDTALV